MKFILPLLLTIFAASCTSTTTQADKPNIIYILADDLGYGDLSCLNENSKIKTPQLDKFASEGMYFTDAHSNSSVCTPTRYGVLTGRYAWRSRLKKSVLGGASNHLINPDRTSVADLLKSQGYETAMIGKWHLGWDFQFKNGSASNGIGFNASKQDIDYTKKIINGPDSIGFDYYYGHCGSLDMAPYVYVENGTVTAAPNRITENKTSKGFWRKGLLELTLSTSKSYQTSSTELVSILKRRLKMISHSSFTYLYQLHIRQSYQQVSLRAKAELTSMVTSSNKWMLMLVK
ncbi:MAG: sulfatase-like hydrolase/transferase [Lentisphaeraceae bacterium]|nr:sulfatase-like hydrolase/transferase [Lentisphaeraceae bacterium]